MSTIFEGTWANQFFPGAVSLEENARKMKSSNRRNPLKESLSPQVSAEAKAAFARATGASTDWRSRHIGESAVIHIQKRERRLSEEGNDAEDGATDSAGLSAAFVAGDKVEIQSDDQYNGKVGVVDSVGDDEDPNSICVQVEGDDEVTCFDPGELTKIQGEPQMSAPAAEPNFTNQGESRKGDFNARGGNKGTSTYITSKPGHQVAKTLGLINPRPQRDGSTNFHHPETGTTPINVTANGEVKIPSNNQYLYDLMHKSKGESRRFREEEAPDLEATEFEAGDEVIVSSVDDYDGAYGTVVSASDEVVSVDIDGEGTIDFHPTELALEAEGPALPPDGSDGEIEEPNNSLPNESRRRVHEGGKYLHAPIGSTIEVANHDREGNEPSVYVGKITGHAGYNKFGQPLHKATFSNKTSRDAWMDEEPWETDNQGGVEIPGVKYSPNESRRRVHEEETRDAIYGNYRAYPEPNRKQHHLYDILLLQGGKRWLYHTSTDQVDNGELISKLATARGEDPNMKVTAARVVHCRTGAIVDEFQL